MNKLIKYLRLKLKHLFKMVKSVKAEVSKPLAIVLPKVINELVAVKPTANIAMNSSQENGLSILNFFIERNKHKISLIIEVLELTVKGETNKAKELLKAQLPFEKKYLSYSIADIYYDKTLYLSSGMKSPVLNRKIKREIFKKDFYHCRYSGLKMFASGVLELLAAIYYDEFPIQYPNGKHIETHQIYWDLGASPDHIIPITHHSDNTFNRNDNVICCSSTLNLVVKNRHPLEALGWQVLPLSALDNSWDGGEKYLKEFANKYPDFFKQEPLNDNHRKLINASLVWSKFIN